MSRLYIPKGTKYQDHILIDYDQQTKRILVEGTHDSGFMLGQESFSLKDFLEGLEISKEDCLEVFNPNARY
jgi:hypothetical protein